MRILHQWDTLEVEEYYCKDYWWCDDSTDSFFPIENEVFFMRSVLVGEQIEFSDGVLTSHWAYQTSLWSPPYFSGGKTQ